MNDSQHPASVDELLDRAVQAINRGDRATADALAEQVLAFDSSNVEAEELLAAPENSGEIRRLTILFADLVDSTALSTRVEPEVYHLVVGSYKKLVRNAVERYEGHIGSTKGDGLLAVFGHPLAHENDGQRAVLAGLDITREVSVLSEKVRQRFGFDIDVRVGVHRGVVYLDTEQDDVYGLGANLAARMCSLAAPGSVAVSATIAHIVRDNFELDSLPAKPVKGVEGDIDHYRVIAERDSGEISRGPLIGREDEVRLSRTGLGPGRKRHADDARRHLPRRGRHRKEPAGGCGDRDGRTVARGHPRLFRIALPHRYRSAARPQDDRAALRHRP